MDALRDLFARFLIPLLVPVLVGIGASAVTNAVLIGRIEERVLSLEKSMVRHETSFDYLTRRTDEQDRRIAHTETALDAMRSDVTEIKADIKTLLRGQ